MAHFKALREAWERFAADDQAWVAIVTGVGEAFFAGADLIPAERAHQMGLLNAIVPRDQLLDAAREYAARMIANAPLAVQATKESALKGLYVDEDAITQVRVAARALGAALEQIDGSDP